MIALRHAEQHSFLVLRQLPQHLAIRADDGGHAGVGGAQHHATGFQCAQLGDLVMLRRRIGMAVPGIVGHVHQQCGLRQGADDLFAEHVFVADVHRHLLPGNIQRGLMCITACQIAHRDVEHAIDEPAQQGAHRDEFAERHQMLLAVMLFFRHTQRENAVVVTAVAAFEHADQHVTAILSGVVAQTLHIVFRHFMAQQWQRGFRQHGEARLILRNQATIGFQRAHQRVFVELEVLRDVTLHQCHRERLAMRLCPCDGTQQSTGTPKHHQCHQRQLPWLAPARLR